MSFSAFSACGAWSLPCLLEIAGRPAKGHKEVSEWEQQGMKGLCRIMPGINTSIRGLRGGLCSSPLTSLIQSTCRELHNVVCKPKPCPSPLSSHVLSWRKTILGNSWLILGLKTRAAADWTVCCSAVLTCCRNSQLQNRTV